MKKLLFCLTLLGIFQQSCGMKEATSKEKVAVLKCPLPTHCCAYLPMQEEQTKHIEDIKKQIAASTDSFTKAFAVYEERFLRYPGTTYVEENLQLALLNLKTDLAGLDTQRSQLHWDINPKSEEYVKRIKALLDMQIIKTQHLMETHVINCFLQLHTLKKESQALGRALNKEDCPPQNESNLDLSENERRANLEKLGHFTAQAS